MNKEIIVPIGVRITDIDDIIKHASDYLENANSKYYYDYNTNTKEIIEFIDIDTTNYYKVVDVQKSGTYVEWVSIVRC